MRVLLIAALVVCVATGAYATNETATKVSASQARAMMDVLGGFPCLNAYSVGVGWDGTNIWVSAGDYETGQCEFYIFDYYGNLVDQQPQGGGSSGWGNRDMCNDGTYMFGSYSSAINGHTYPPMAVAGFFYGPINPNRALAYDGATFYTCGFGEYLWALEWDGSWYSSATATILSGTYSGAYGLAYDCANGCLWMTTADYSGDIYQFDLDGAILGIYNTYTSPYYIDIHGGCEMIVHPDHGQCLMILHQSDPDYVYFVDVEASGPSAVENASWGGVKALYR